MHFNHINPMAVLYRGIESHICFASPLREVFFNFDDCSPRLFPSIIRFKVTVEILFYIVYISIIKIYLIFELLPSRFQFVECENKVTILSIKSSLHYRRHCFPSICLLMSRRFYIIIYNLHFSFQYLHVTHRNIS